MLKAASPRRRPAALAPALRAAARRPGSRGAAAAAELPRRAALCSLLAAVPFSCAAAGGADSPTPAAYFTPPTRVTAPGRVVAIGDLHGDLAQARPRARAAPRS
jgi:hypothetical protein